MAMKKNIIYGLLVAVGMMSSCSDFTDIQPKGTNLLNTTDQLALLFNNEITPSFTAMSNVGGSTIYTYNDVPTMINQPNKSLSAYYFSFDDSPEALTRREILTTSDGYYTDLFSYVGKIANPVLSQLPSASGDEATKNALKAEALTLRAYSEFMLLQKFAKAYNPATAAKDPGIAYLKEDADILSSQPKLTVQECYDNCLKDINDAIALNAMPAIQPTVFRLNKASMFAVKALVCMSMQKYAEAEEAAKQALELNGNLYDYYAHATEKQSMGGYSYLVSTVAGDKNPEAYFFTPCLVMYSWVQPDVASQFEKGYATYSLFDSMNKRYKGIGKVMPAYAEFENYGAKIGLAGWDAGFDVENQINTSGLSSAMMYLLVVECEIRNGSIDNAMTYLDKLRKARLDPSTFTPLKGTVTSKEEAIKAYKRDYVAENIWTGWNFIARKRWNVDPDWQETLTRKIGDKTYTLSPKSQLWVFPFPSPVRENNPNMTSNTND